MGKPSINVLKESQKVIHPKSRKAKQLSKKVSRVVKLKKRREESRTKLQFLGDKLAWFKENLNEKSELAPSDVLDLIQRYIDRNAEELEQINLKNMIGNRTSRQHASREDMIRITREREMDQFISSGFETVDLLNPDTLKVFKTWTGELRYLQNIRLRKFIKKDLESGIETEDISSPSSMADESEGEDSDMEEDKLGSSTGAH